MGIELENQEKIRLWQIWERVPDSNYVLFHGNFQNYQDAKRKYQEKGGGEHLELSVLELKRSDWEKIKDCFISS